MRHSSGGGNDLGFLGIFFELGPGHWESIHSNFGFFDMCVPFFGVVVVGQGGRGSSGGAVHGREKRGGVGLLVGRTALTWRRGGMMRGAVLS